MAAVVFAIPVFLVSEIASSDCSSCDATAIYGTAYKADGITPVPDGTKVRAICDGSPCDPGRSLECTINSGNGTYVIWMGDDPCIRDGGPYKMKAYGKFDDCVRSSSETVVHWCYSTHSCLVQKDFVLDITGDCY
jgi:hypothetical protein